MKKKGHPTIPDFSSKRAAAPASGSKLPKPKAAAPPPASGAKPHATSKKSGRRGS